MIQDNQWHEGIVYQHSDDGEFVLVDSYEEGDADDRPKTMATVDGVYGIKHQTVKYNWNKGQPIVDFGEFQMCITDIGFVEIEDEL